MKALPILLALVFIACEKVDEEAPFLYLPGYWEFLAFWSPQKSPAELEHFVANFQARSEAYWAIEYDGSRVLPFSGQTMVNRFYGKLYAGAGDNLSMAQWQASTGNGPEEILVFEKRFLQAMENIRSFQIKTTETGVSYLILYYTKKGDSLIFRRKK